MRPKGSLSKAIAGVRTFLTVIRHGVSIKRLLDDAERNR
jgi:hypothetical protein